VNYLATSDKTLDSGLLCVERQQIPLSPRTKPTRTPHLASLPHQRPLATIRAVLAHEPVLDALPGRVDGDGSRGVSLLLFFFRSCSPNPGRDSPPERRYGADTDIEDRLRDGSTPPLSSNARTPASTEEVGS